MKKLILSIALLSGIAFTTQAQTEKGKFLVGGNASFETKKSDASGAKAANSFSLIPNVGYFIKDNLAVGTGVGFATSKNDVQKNQAFVIKPYGRHYTSVAQNFKFFGQLSVPMAFGTEKEVVNSKVGKKTGKTTSIGVALSPGFAYYPSSKLGIEFAFKGIAYENYRVKDGDGKRRKGHGHDSFSIGADFFNPTVGIQFLF